MALERFRVGQVRAGATVARLVAQDQRKVCRMKRTLNIASLTVLSFSVLMSVLSPAQAAPVPQPTPVSVGVIPVQSMGAFQWGIDSGVFKRNGISVQSVSVLPNPPLVLGALTTGEVQFAYMPLMPIINSYAKAGAPLRIVAPGSGLASAKDLANAQADASAATKIGHAAVCANAASGVNSWSSLAGKRVGVVARGQQGEILIANAVKSAGGDPASITWVEMPFAQVIPALQSGTIDAGFLDEPYSQQCSTSGFVNLGNPGVTFFTGTAVVGVWVTTASFLEENPEVVRKFQKSLYEVHQAVMTSTKKMAQAVIASTKITGATRANARAANPMYFPLRVTRVSIAGPVNKMLALGYLSSNVDIRDLLARQYRP